MVTTLEHTTLAAGPSGGGLARRQNAATAVVCGVILAWVFWFTRATCSRAGATTGRTRLRS